ncbi:hypothetical protein O3G_MSEX007793 [Manduca sexta]|uniref:Uncharacterized protein n=1 Tax=Manduca sexta TaxID=7130 RepID=A0A921Z7G4_MANSE|nr:hypothetical protein O3G_MSEX007793 [Manduca sexta]
MTSNYNKYYFKGDYYNKQSLKFPEAQYDNPIDLFIPLNSKTKYSSKTEATTVLPSDNRDKFTVNEKKILDLPQIIYKSNYEPNKSSCFCKRNRLPCDCKCIHCMISVDSFPGQYTERSNMYDDKKPFRNPFLSDISFKGPDYISEDKTGDNTLNFRIKIDVSMPKMPFGNLLRTFNPGNTVDDDNDYSKAANLPLPFYNFPIPIDTIGYNKIKFSKHDSMPLHKMTIQRKKKSKTNSNGKKHRKKLITFHNIKIEPQFFTTHFEDIYNNRQSTNLTTVTQSTFAPNVTDKLETEKPYENQNLKENHTEDTIYLMVNITSDAGNKTDVHKNENSVEADYFKKVISNFTIDKPMKLRTKRDVPIVLTTEINSTNSVTINDLSVLPISKNNSKSTTERNNITKYDNVLFSDVELLHWPNSNISGYSKNITAIILEKENKKAKLNVSKETLRRNHTHALEQAIFGDVNWNDVDTIAPTFMSFVGKYIKGALTFCSESVCHSMKCAEKKCVHRICSPDERMNNKGHCAGSNSTGKPVNNS